jgi:drug/metabolite transporter (DMT)-like permease
LSPVDRGAPAVSTAAPTEPGPLTEPAHWRRAMTPLNIALLLFAVSTAACGQVLLKYGMQRAALDAVTSGSSLAVRAVTSPWVMSGLCVFGVAVVAWMITLSRLPLNIAYPFNALGYLVILSASVLILGEHANMWTWIGTSTVVLGLIIVVASRP